MKNETKVKYQARIDAAMETVSVGMTASGDNPTAYEKWQVLFRQGKEILNIVYGQGSTFSTHLVANMLGSLEGRIDRAAKGLPEVEADLLEGDKQGLVQIEPTLIEPSADGSVQQKALKQIGDAMEQLTIAYNSMLQANSLAAYVPEVQALNGSVVSLRSVMQGLARINFGSVS